MANIFERVGRLKQKYENISELKYLMDYITESVPTLAPLMTFEEDGKQHVPYLGKDLRWFDYWFVVEAGEKKSISKIIHEQSEAYKTINQNNFVFKYDNDKRDFVAHQYADGIKIDTIEGRREIVSFLRENYDVLHDLQKERRLDEAASLSV